MDMKAFYKNIARAADITRAVSSVLAFIFAISWFFQLVNMPIMNAILYFFEPVAKLIREFIFFHTMTFGDKTFDNTYLIAALLCVGLILICTKLNTYALTQVENVIFKENIKRASADRKVNVELKKEYKKQMSTINYFVICLRLGLKYSINESLLEDKANLGQLKNANYTDIMETMSRGSATSVDVYDDKIAIVCPGYNNFEKVFGRFLEATNEISNQNKRRDVTTDIFFVVDASESARFTDEKNAFLTKILSFGYKNKAVSTTAFASRYQQEPNMAYTLNTMGKIRFFEDQNTEGPNHNYTDFELFTLRKKR